jgi:hypothetical protein
MKKNPLGAALSKARGSKKPAEAAAPAEEKPTRFKNPDYVQTTVYLHRETVHKPLKVALAEDEREFSELVESLLADWLKSRKK